MYFAYLFGIAQNMFSEQTLFSLTFRASHIWISFQFKWNKTEIHFLLSNFESILCNLFNVCVIHIKNAIYKKSAL